MTILILPSFYPDTLNSNLGSFFKEQVVSLAERGINTDVVYVEQLSLHKFSWSLIKKNYFQSIVVQEPFGKEYRILGWKIPGILGEEIWKFLTIKLVKKYILLHGKPDLIHAHNLFCAGEVAVTLKNRYKIPVVITEHDSAFIMNTLSRYKKKLSNKMFPRFDSIIAVSNNLAKSIKQYSNIKNIEIIPNVVDTDFFIPSMNSPISNKIRFLAIGNLNKNKGHRLLVSAFAEVFKKNSNISLTICGDGPEKSPLLQQIRNLNLENDITLLGHLNKDEILKQLQKCSCLVLSSYYETFGVVLVEAMSCGKPFIATKCGGSEDVFEDGVGFVIEKGDVTVLSIAMLEFINNKDNFSSSLIRSKAIEKYSRGAVVAKISQVYSDTEIDTHLETRVFD